MFYKDGNTKIVSDFWWDQQTYQAWKRNFQRPSYEINPRSIHQGIYDKDGKVIGFYKNETDNYKQQHYHFYGTTFQ